ncbi:MAG: hypothetical protein IPK76_26240 [Lewinellaceae bacterium]|nr:hypothetical protein [Lewinellaceae bacterium]
MKPILILIFCSMMPGETTAQELDFWNRCGNVFDRNKYPADSFEVRETVYELEDTRIILTILHAVFSLEETEDQTWIEQRKDDWLLGSRYLGFVSMSEGGVALPERQLLQDFFIIKSSGEFTGAYYLISMEGDWYEIPGNELFMDKAGKMLYTYVPYECGGCAIGKFDVAGRELTTKFSGGGDDAWPEVKDRKDYVSLFWDCTWVKW